MSLTLATITALQLPLIETRAFSLGNNATVDFDLYSATIVWDGQERDILGAYTDASWNVHGFLRRKRRNQ